MASDLHAHLRKQMDSARKFYVADLSALTHDQLNTSPGGVARCGYDYTYEVAYVNARVAKRLRGEVPEPYPEGWITAPDEFRVRDRAIDAINASTDEVLLAWDAIASDDIHKGFIAANGEEVSFVDIMSLASYHMGYHDGQLNYLQAMLGDGQMHWQD